MLQLSAQPATSDYRDLSLYNDVIWTASLLQIIIATACRWHLSLKCNWMDDPELSNCRSSVEEGLIKMATLAQSAA